MRLLIIDDNPQDRELVKRTINKVFSDVSYVEVIHQQAFEEETAHLNYEVVLTDYQLKWSTGIEVTRAIRARNALLPIIMVTDTGSEEIAAEAMKQGLNDYVLKTHLYRLPLALKECLDRVQWERERQELQAQILQAQKMESLGLLVSGIAHDFNNLLAAIAGFSELGKSRSAQDAPFLHEYFEHIHQRAEQGERMTKQLLAFARGTPLQPEYLNVNQHISDLSSFLQTLLGSSITVTLDQDPQLKAVYADATQLEQLLVNLCVNARDAMPMGGNLEIITRQIEILQGTQHVHHYLAPGSYVLIQVKDTGIGMEKEVLDRLFEPFFTTKEMGKGTGLGLSVVYGIVHQHQGDIRVQSQPGQGSTFSLYFPAVEHVAESSQQQEQPERSINEADGETLLLVEDDADIQWMMREVLEDAGYKVMVAGDGEEGLKVFEEHASSISLVIADIMMPKMQGRQFQEHVRRQRRDIKVLIISGYQEMDLKRRDLLDARSAFLQKPFALDALIGKVQELLS